MRKTRSKTTEIERHAQTGARAIVKDGQPEMTSDLERYLDTSSHEIFDALDGLARHMTSADENENLETEAVAFGHLFLWQGMLQRLRYRADRGYTEPAALLSQFQAEVAARFEADEID